MSENKGFFQRAFDDMKESAKKQHEIDKENFEAVKVDSKARFDSAKQTTPDMQEFKDAEGFVEKAKVVMSHIERDAKATAEENRENYKKMLEEQRKNTTDLINKN